MPKISISSHVVSKQSNEFEFKFSGDDLYIGETIIPNYLEYCGFVFDFKIICISWEEVERSNANDDGSRIIRLYSKFINKKPILDNPVQISVSRPNKDCKEKKTVLSPSHDWTEIYDKNSNCFEVLVKVSLDHTNSSCVQTNNKCVQTEKETINIVKTIYTDEETINIVKTIYTDEDLPDFHIVGESNEGIKESVGFHRTVLYAWSPTFKKMFTEAWKEKSEGKVELPWNVEVIEAFKKFLYLQELPSDRETLLSLIEMGSCYMIPKLESDAIKAVVNITNAENINESLEFSYIKKLVKLTEAMLLEIKSSDIDVKSIFTKDEEK